MMTGAMGGKSVLGALLGGYLVVEIAKRLVRHQAPTGDRFAAIVPVGLVISRLGCLSHGCCLGIPMSGCWIAITDRSGVARWPAVPAEIAFNLVAAVGFFCMRKSGRWLGQHFHLYLIGYGMFRFGHEFLRATPKLPGGISGYQIAALAVAALGMCGFFVRRWRRGATPAVSPSPNRL